MKKSLRSVFNKSSEEKTEGASIKELDRAQLEQFASVNGVELIASQAQIDPKDYAMAEMYDWCKKQGDIAVLNTGVILCSDPRSRSVRNCKIMLNNMGIRPGKVYPALHSVIEVMLANARESAEHISEAMEVDEVSAQQQRLRLLVREAIQAKVSDIHLEVRRDIARIRFRKHGALYLHAEWLPEVGREVAAVAFNKETDQTSTHFNPLVPQNASMPLLIDEKEVRLRLASLPAHGGFDVVMRVLATDDEKAPPLEELGYTQDQVFLIKKASQMPHGAVLIAGPTGSGKTTTLASCLQMIDKKRKIYTTEDPVEKILKNATQVPINTEIEEKGFASAGRASLRMDPDIIMLGETRDVDTARIMVRAAITGHLVYSTVHTNSAAMIVTRLVDMGISPRMLGDSDLLVCLIFQRLVAVLCQHCAIPIKESRYHEPAIARWEEIFKKDMATIKGVPRRGCDYCKGMGVAGRTVVAETIWVDEPGREFIYNTDMIGWTKYLKKQGWKSYKDRTLELVREGCVDPYEAEKVVGSISKDMGLEKFDYTNLTREK